MMPGYKIDVPYIDQSIKYPTGCESVSTVMLLRYLGYDIIVDEFINQYLEMEGVKEEYGILYGPDPYKRFAGSPYDADSFGCYAPVICNALCKILGKKYEVIDETGTDMPELLIRYIEKDMPVIVWASINMKEPVTGPSWELLGNEKEFTWISNEHCMLLVGYDEKQYYFNDPYENNGLTGYDKEIFEKRYAAYYKQAIGVKKIC